MEERYPASQLATGYRWEATLYLTLWEAIEERYGRDVAVEMCGKAMYETGVRFGRAMAERAGRNDLAALKETWEELYPTGPDTEWNGKRFVVKNKACIIEDTLSLYDIPPQRWSDIAQVFCEGDRGFVNGFNPNIRFTWGGRILRNEPECVWIMEEPAE